MTTQDGKRQPRPSHAGPTWDSKHVLLYTCIGLAFILLLVLSFVVESPSALRDLLRTLAVAIGPVWILGMLYQHFLFKEIRSAATQASADALLIQTRPLIADISASAEQVRGEVANMMNLRDLGIERAYKRRKDVLRLVCEWVRAEEEEIALVGTSLRGLFWKELGAEEAKVADALRDKLSAEARTCRFQFLLTHPAFAQLRQGLERLHRPAEFRISDEIRTSVDRLLEMGAKPQEIAFVRATPTCFAIKTSTHMLINPYPLENQSLASFCIIVGNEDGRNAIYTAFEEYHFVFYSANCVRFSESKEIDKVFQESLSSVLESLEKRQA